MIQLHELEKFTEALEARMWQSHDIEAHLAEYQQHFANIERAYANGEPDNRYSFLIIIPVADRPQHLQSCLESLQTQLKLYGYGTGSDSTRVSVLIADDSKQPDSITRHQSITKSFNQRGLKIEYFGFNEQINLIQSLSDDERGSFADIIGNNPLDAFYHKGASIMRNITYLKLAQMQDQQTLFYFIDSDQEFNTLIDVNGKSIKLDAINFFYHLDQLFRTQNIEVLTGKVVGDPPVSPAVMAGNFLEDVITFFQQLSQLDGDGVCQFHQHKQMKADDASYHDMADLFGFRTSEHSYRYQCTLEGSHNHTACLQAFAEKLNTFFDGEHPTRKSFFEYQPPSSTVSARTIYTGNYIFKPSALRYFIPFAPLKLRMAGPVLGRIIKAETGGRFVSSYLPMLHKRTVDELGASEFRPGVEHSNELTDLSGEFERQYFGDVMLFSIEQLTTQGYPQITISSEAVANTVKAIDTEMQQRYLQKQQIINTSMQTLQQLLDNNTHWWHQSSPDAVRQTQHFIDTIRNNFKPDAKGYQMIGSATRRDERLNQIITAIAHYPEVRKQWITKVSESKL